MTPRTIVGLVGAALPIAYCIGLIWYFLDLGAWNDPVLARELGPTIIGLGVVALVCVVALALRARRAMRSRPPGAQGGNGGPGPAGPGDAPREADADAMIARYLAQRAADAPQERTPPAAGGKVAFGRRASR